MSKKIVLFLLSLFLFNFNVYASEYIAPVDITKMSIVELQDAMEIGYLNSELLVNLYLERINEYDYMFNSINQLNPKAIEQAKQLDKEREEGKVRGPLHGIPILIKANIDDVDFPTTGGTKSLKDNYAINNSYVVQKLVDAGAIILGSTNMSELAFSAGNSYSSYGHVKNVFDTDYSSYGSSGGSAVSVGAAFAAASLGTDTNASVRIPASAAGLVGLRPTFGLISRDGVIPYDIERDTVGIMSKSVYDNAIILNIISGEDENDSSTIGSSSYDIDSYDELNLSNVNIGVVSSFILGNNSNNLNPNKLISTNISPLVNSSLKVLEDAGANLVYIDPFLTGDYALINTTTYAGITMCDEFNKYIEGTTGTIRSFEQLAKSSGHVQTLSGYVSGCGNKYKDKSVRDEKKHVYKDYITGVFEKYNVDVIIYPTTKNDVLKIGEKGLNAPGSYIGGVIGFPSITVPMGFVDGFSYGMEFLSLPYTEDILYNIAAAFEKENGNEVQSSVLTPSLYEIPESVEKLKLIYEEENNFVLKEEKELKNDIKDFFVHYNDIDDINKKAQELIDRYNNLNNEPKVFVLKTILKIVGKITLKFIIILLSLILLFILRKKIRHYRKRKRRHKK